MIKIVWPKLEFYVMLIEWFFKAIMTDRELTDF